MATHSYFHDIRAAKEATIRHGPVRGDDSGSGEIGHYAANEGRCGSTAVTVKQRPRVISIVICYSSVRRETVFCRSSISGCLRFRRRRFLRFNSTSRGTLSPRVD